MSEWYVRCLYISKGQVRTSQVRIGKVRTGQVRTSQDRCLECVWQVGDPPNDYELLIIVKLHSMSMSGIQDYSLKMKTKILNI